MAAKPLRTSDNVPVILSLIFPSVIQNASITLEQIPSSPPANTAYYLVLSLVSVIVVAAKLYRSFDSVSVVVSGTISLLVIQKTSILLEYPLLYLPPANTAYYFLLSLVSVIVVAAKLLRAFDSAPYIDLIVFL